MVLRNGAASLGAIERFVATSSIGGGLFAKLFLLRTEIGSQ